MVQETEYNRFMTRAIELALLGDGLTNPNPLVGAVIEKDGQILGEGYHERYGDLHAERNALKECFAKGNDPRGATMYVTLEPCCHTGKQPPCVDAILESGISKVVIGSRDPNPLVRGKGAEYLRNAGIQVVEDVERKACDALNQIFFEYITTKVPYTIVKWAMTADGHIACANGDSRWITGTRARKHVHALRNRVAAIMVGIGTVIADDPQLTCRLDGGNNPLRIVCDTHLAIPLDSALVKTAKQVPLLVACASDAGVEDLKIETLESCGVQVLCVPLLNGHIDIRALMTELGKRGIDSVLAEGGSTLNRAVLDAGVCSELAVYIAPKVLGGHNAMSPVGGESPLAMDKALRFHPPQVLRLGDDVLLGMRTCNGFEQADGTEPPCVCTGPLGLWRE
ncbi:MAG: bifunctional diaminohydroxyphosphoribosylaminopyrimidine deaminase/5-amino-6-(5-phosphoribosylamino)uracil reductase RibD [Coriobacteriales bacterium]|nr:bifunctional diaminohydroxyphosphoribosylaminopyrimidine deaminase/5-amino-6-(5-phosphoribosylamino)uracil reductase RibD [Coriobacteriales bacterium]